MKKPHRTFEQIARDRKLIIGYLECHPDSTKKEIDDYFESFGLTSSAIQTTLKSTKKWLDDYNKRPKGQSKRGRPPKNASSVTAGNSGEANPNSDKSNVTVEETNSQDVSSNDSGKTNSASNASNITASKSYDSQKLTSGNPEVSKQISKPEITSYVSETLTDLTSKSLQNTMNKLSKLGVTVVFDYGLSNLSRNQIHTILFSCSLYDVNVKILQPTVDKWNETVGSFDTLNTDEKVRAGNIKLILKKIINEKDYQVIDSFGDYSNLNNFIYEHLDNLLNYIVENNYVLITLSSKYATTLQYLSQMKYGEKGNVLVLYRKN